jgi:Putative Flp pilus-assembly TadE/G-like
MTDNDAGRPFLRRALKDESGQVLVWMCFLFAIFLGMAGLTLDLGHAYTCYEQLQASTDAATLSGAYAMSLPNATFGTSPSSGTVNAAVQNFSSGTGGANINPNLPNVSVTVTPLCLASVTSTGVLCGAGPGTHNALQVVQTSTIPTLFIQGLSIFGIKSASSLTLATASTAAMRGAQNAQYNVAMVVDTTASMGDDDTDASCGTARITCALQGVQTLLTNLTPCAGTPTSTSCNAFDQVSLFTFPPVLANTAANDTSCPSSNPTIAPYSTPTAGGTWTPTDFSSSTPTYQLTTYLSNYATGNVAGSAVSSSSALGIATGSGVGTKKSACNGLQTPGGDGTYFAGVIYAALSSLAAAQTATPGSQNALIILSDGDADATSAKITNSTANGATYGSYQDQCAQAVAAAKTASSMTNTTVYTIAYGAASSGCASDVKSTQNVAGTNITPCQTMQQMATSALTFYSDATASANKGQCVSASNPSLTLNQIFKQVATQFTVARLIPNGSS